MTYDEKCRLTLHASLQECGRHCDRLERGIELLHPIFPLTRESLEKLNETQVALLDQYLYRFMKLQDAMGIRVLPSVHTLLYGTFEPVPFLNILASLEKSATVLLPSVWG